MRNTEFLQSIIKTGDSIHFQSPVTWNPIDWVGWAIREITNAPINHCGKIVIEDNDVFVYEATKNGVIRTLFESRLKYYKGKIIITTPPLTFNKDVMLYRLKDEIGWKGYDYVGLVGFYFFKYLKEVYNINLRADWENRSWFCSELCAYVDGFYAKDETTPIDYFRKSINFGSKIRYCEIVELCK